jgi:membrane protein implicated in regulation of membrane protease activity
MNADPPAPEPPQVFERVGRAQLAGCVAYLLMIPAFIIVAGLIAGILGAGITQLLKMGETASLVLCLILAGLSMIAAGYFGVRNYRSRSGARVEVTADYIECSGDIKTRRIRYDDLEWIQAFGSAILKLGAKGGVRMNLRSEEWPVEKIHDALMVRVVPRMAARNRDEVLDGKEIVFATPMRQVAWMFVFGTALLMVAGTIGLKSFGNPANGSGRIGLAAVIFAFAAAGVATLIRGVSEGRSYVVTERGIRAQTVASAERVWSGLADGRVTKAGLWLNFQDGMKPIKISGTRPNFAVMVALVKSLTAEEAWIKAPQ